MIKSFRHKGVEQFFKTGSRAKIQPKHADKLKLQLAALDNAKSEKDMNAPGARRGVPQPFGSRLDYARKKNRRS